MQTGASVEKAPAQKILINKAQCRAARQEITQAFQGPATAERFSGKKIAPAERRTGVEEMHGLGLGIAAMPLQPFLVAPR